MAVPRTCWYVATCLECSKASYHSRDDDKKLDGKEGLRQEKNLLEGEMGGKRRIVYA